MQVKYSVSDDVLVGQNKIKGTVIGIHITHNQIEYQIRYFQSGESKTAYFYEFELLDDDRLPVGFTITKG